jgi:hypothetical protein
MRSWPIQDTTCESVNEIRDEVLVFFAYVRQFMDVFEDPQTRINPDFDFGLLLMEGRIRKIRGMLKSLFGDSGV